MNQKTLKGFVEEILQNKFMLEVKFSAKDILDEMRVFLNGGIVTLFDRQKEDVDGINTYRVHYHEVRALVLDILDAHYDFETFHNNAWKVFKIKQLSQNTQVSKAQVSNSPAISAIISKPNVQIQSPIVSQVLESKIEKYLDNQFNANHHSDPNLKRIQSRLKGFNVKVGDIAKIIDNSLSRSYKVIRRNRVFSKSIVIKV